MPVSPSDDPDDWEVDTSVGYDVEVSEPRWVVPAENLPAACVLHPANNNVAIALFEGRLFLAWRSAPSHFASSEAVINIVSSVDDGVHWDFEHLVQLGTDVREPFLYETAGRLYLTYFEAGSNPLAFEPQRMWRTFRRGRGDWAPAEAWGEAGEVPWEAKVRGGRAWFTRYLGDHYGPEGSAIRLRFFTSADGIDWRPAAGDDPTVYVGGASEAGFEFDAEGALWAVLRNEDGDATGFGSLLCRAPATDLGRWECPAASDPERYDSPRMFRHGDDVYLVARRDVGGPFDLGRDDLTFEQQRSLYLREYSLRPKRTALYGIDRAARRVVWLRDLPGVGDTCFPSIRRLDAHSFLLANYTSPLDDPNISWLEAQTSSRGTAIYLLVLRFVPRR